MSSYTIQKLADGIIISTLLPTWEMRTDLVSAMDDLTRLLDAAQQPVVYISDIRQLPTPRLDDLIWGMNQVTRTARAVLHHPNIKETVLVTTNAALNLAARGARADAFGNVRIHVCASVEEALAHARRALQEAD